MKLNEVLPGVQHNPDLDARQQGIDDANRVIDWMKDITARTLDQVELKPGLEAHTSITFSTSGGMVLVGHIDRYVDDHLYTVKQLVVDMDELQLQIKRLKNLLQRPLPLKHLNAQLEMRPDSSFGSIRFKIRVSDEPSRMMADAFISRLDTYSG